MRRSPCLMHSFLFQVQRATTSITKRPDRMMRKAAENTGTHVCLTQRHKHHKRKASHRGTNKCRAELLRLSVLATHWALLSPGSAWLITWNYKDLIGEQKSTLRFAREYWKRGKCEASSLRSQGIVKLQELEACIETGIRPHFAD